MLTLASEASSRGQAVADVDSQTNQKKSIDFTAIVNDTHHHRVEFIDERPLIKYMSA